MSYRLYLLAPVAGSLLFAILYVAATHLYPGGSQADAHAVGFSWAHNYWCNLLNVTAINGQPNPARPVAEGAMLVLCGSLGLFWVVAPPRLPLRPGLRRTTQVAGVLALLAAGGLLVPGLDHDLATNTASGLGVLATTGIFVGLYRARWRGLFGLGCLNLLLVGLNNLCYYNPALIRYLPVVQKATFTTFLLWVSGTAIGLYRRAAVTSTPEAKPSS